MGEVTDSQEPERTAKTTFSENQKPSQSYLLPRRRLPFHHRRLWWRHQQRDGHIDNLDRFRSGYSANSNFLAFGRCTSCRNGWKLCKRGYLRVRRRRALLICGNLRLTHFRPAAGCNGNINTSMPVIPRLEPLSVGGLSFRL
jgi:hypothetical protein